MISPCFASALTAVAGFLEGLAGQGSDIDAIFEIEAQIVDDVLNETTRSVGAGRASKPQSPSRSGSPPRKPADTKSLPLSPLLESPPPPLHVRNTSSPGQMTEFPSPGSTGESSPLRGQRLSDARSEDSHGVLELFRQDSEQSSQHRLPTILQTPPRLHLPPRHVRTRRDSHAVQLHRMTTSGGQAGPQPSANSDPLALISPTTAPVTGIGISPLGQLYGTVVVEEDGQESSLGLGALTRGLSVSQAKRLRTMSAGANTSNRELPAFRGRRGSSNPGMPDVPTEELPETIQEAEDDAENRKAEASNKRDEEVMRLLEQVQSRQVRIESQMKELLEVLQRQR
jgi:hypothetical protein